MSDLNPRDVILAQLTGLVGSETLPVRAHDVGARLLRRLTSPVSVGIFGPNPDERAEVYQLLSPYTDVNIALSDAPSGRFDGVDIALWVTRVFDAAEQEKWDSSPDFLKDHSYLLCLDPVTDHHEDHACESFVALVPLCLGQQPSGIEDLARQLTGRVQHGREADRDHASLFVETHKALLAGLVLSEPAAASVAPTPQMSANAESTPAGSLFETIAAHLRQDAQDIGGLTFESGPEDYAAVLHQCSATAEALSGICADDPSNGAQEVLFKEDIMMAADSLVLMSLEKGIGPAIDAVTTLLQIQRDVQAQIAR